MFRFAQTAWVFKKYFFIKKTVTVRGKQMQPYKGSELTSTSYNASLLIIEAVT